MGEMMRLLLSQLEDARSRKEWDRAIVLCEIISREKGDEFIAVQMLGIKRNIKE